MSPRRSVHPFVGLSLSWIACFMALIGAPAAAQERPLRVVALGDSLTAGYGLPGSAAFPAQLERALRARGHRVSVANAGVSGDTAAQGRARFDWAVPEGTDAVIVELGANDALRGLDPRRTEAALDAILQRLQQRRIPVLLAGMYAPRQLGAEYVQAFDAIYPRLAGKYGVLLYPFFLDGIVGDAALNLPDGIHPTQAGVARIVERILPSVEQLLGRVTPRSPAG